MLDIVANGVAENVEDDLSDDEEENAERNVAQWPAILEGANNEDDLTDNIHEQENGVDNVCDDEDAHWVLRIQTSPFLEGEE